MGNVLGTLWRTCKSDQVYYQPKNKLYKNKKPFLLNYVEITTYYKTED